MCPVAHKDHKLHPFVSTLDHGLHKRNVDPAFVKVFRIVEQTLRLDIDTHMGMLAYF